MLACSLNVRHTSAVAMSLGHWASLHTWMSDWKKALLCLLSVESDVSFTPAVLCECLVVTTPQKKKPDGLQANAELKPFQEFKRHPFMIAGVTSWGKTGVNTVCPCNRQLSIFSQRNDQFIKETNSLMVINKNILLRDSDDGATVWNPIIQWVFSQKQWDIFAALFLYTHLTYGVGLNNQVGMCLI